MSLLSKATAITLPAALLVIDIYPLKRLPWSPLRWFAPALRPVLWEKVLFIAVALPFALFAVVGRQQMTESVSSLEKYGAGWRLFQMLYTPAFHMGKTLVFYEIPPYTKIADPSAVSVALAALAVALTIFFYCKRERWPAGLACSLWMIVVLGPVLGLVQAAPVFRADRYSYLSCLSWAALVGGVLLHRLRPRVQRRTEKRRCELRGQTPLLPRTPLVAAAAVLVVLVSLSWNQIPIWRDTGTLFGRFLLLDPDPGQAHDVLRQWAVMGNHSAMLAHNKAAAIAWPRHYLVRHNLAVILADLGDLPRSAAHAGTERELGEIEANEKSRSGSEETKDSLIGRRRLSKLIELSAADKTEGEFSSILRSDEENLW